MVDIVVDEVSVGLARIRGISNIQMYVLGSIFFLAFLKQE